MKLSITHKNKNLKNIFFLDKSMASQVLREDDSFYSSLSQFDIKSRNIISGDARKYYGKQTLDWDSWMIGDIFNTIGVIDWKMREYTMRFPEEIKIILTTGREEDNAAYCRKNSIILSIEKANYMPRNLEKVIIHELFHIYSWFNPEKRKLLYNILGFKDCPRLAYFPDEVEHYITNPDTFKYPCCMILNDKKYMPIIYSPVEFGKPIENDYITSERCNHKEELTFSDYMTFGLIEIEIKHSKSFPILQNNKLIIHDTETLPEYFGKIGRNTKNITHPEEILAVYFVHLINKNYKVRDTEILHSIREIMNR